MPHRYWEYRQGEWNGNATSEHEVIISLNLCSENITEVLVLERNETEIEQDRVTYLMHESDMARDDLKNRRLWMTVNGLVAVIAFVAIYGVLGRCQSRHS